MLRFVGIDKNTYYINESRVQLEINNNSGGFPLYYINSVQVKKETFYNALTELDDVSKAIEYESEDNKLYGRD